MITPVFLKAPLWEGKRLNPPHSFEILLRLTFPASSEPTTSRFKAIYPLLKQLALVRTTSNSRAIIEENIFTVSLRLSGEENTALAEEARSIAIWSLTVDKDCWEIWRNLCNRNVKVSLDILKTLVGKFKDGELEAMNEQIFNFLFYLAARGNLPQQATAIWSLNIIVDSWKQRDNISVDNLKACVRLLENLIERCTDHSFNGSPSASDSFAGSPGSKARKQITRKIFTLSLKLAGEGQEAATSIASWCLSENVDCWKNWDNLYQENPEASVALLKTLLEEWKDHSLDLVLSPSDALALGQTMKSFMLQNKNAITGGRAKASLYKEADKSCKLISSRLSASLYKEADKSCKVISSRLPASLYKEADKSCKVISSILSCVRSTPKDTSVTAWVLVAVGVLAAGVATAGLKSMLDVNAITTTFMI